MSESVFSNGNKSGKMEIEEEYDEDNYVPYDSDEEAQNQEMQEQEINDYLVTLGQKVNQVVETMMRANTVFDNFNETQKWLQ